MNRMETLREFVPPLPRAEADPETGVTSTHVDPSATVSLSDVRNVSEDLRRALRDIHSWCADIGDSTLTLAEVAQQIRGMCEAALSSGESHA